MLLPTSDGLGFAGEKKLQPTRAVDPLDPTVDLATIRAEKRRREIEEMSKPQAREGSDVFASDEFDTRSNAKLSLREQLQLNRERAEAAWKEKHNPFAPPPGESTGTRAHDLRAERAMLLHM